MSYWILSDSSLPDGPVDGFSEAFAQASKLSEEFCESVVIYSGEGITNWSPVKYLATKGM